MKKLMFLLVVCLLVTNICAKTKPYISISFRDGYNDTEYMEYELKGGVESAWGRFDIKYERDSDIYYKGVYLKTAETNIKREKYGEWSVFDGFSGEIDIDQSVNLNEEFIYKTLMNPFNSDSGIVVKVRLVNKWVNWADYRVLVGVIANFKTDLVTFKTEYSSDLNGHYIFKLKADKKSKLG